MVSEVGGYQAGGVCPTPGDCTGSSGSCSPCYPEGGCLSTCTGGPNWFTTSSTCPGSSSGTKGNYPPARSYPTSHVLVICRDPPVGTSTATAVYLKSPHNNDKCADYHTGNGQMCARRFHTVACLGLRPHPKILSSLLARAPSRSLHSGARVSVYGAQVHGRLPRRQQPEVLLRRVPRWAHPHQPPLRQVPRLEQGGQQQPVRRGPLVCPSPHPHPHVREARILSPRPHPPSPDPTPSPV